MTLNISLIISFAFVWLIKFYFFGMQRASLLIARTNEIDWKQIGQHILPRWYRVVWLIIVVQWILLALIFYFCGWAWALGALVISFILSSVIPIPYRLLYRKIFYKRLNAIKQIDAKAGDAFRQMLENIGF